MTGTETTSDPRRTMDLPRSVYIHVPFCKHRCGYCNFTLVTGRDHLVDDFLAALEIELSTLSGRPSVNTIYLGGGTPSYLATPQLRRLINIIERHFDLANDGEFTIEVNPEDVTDDLANVIVESGINRVSVGIQSFNEPKLRSLDRFHSLSQIESAISRIKQIVDRISIDLIFAAPVDSGKIWADDLTAAMASQVGHISTYELTIERGTTFWNQQFHGRLEKPDEDRCLDFYELAMERLPSAGWEQYEISSFARPDQRSRHNQVYWSGKPYWAFGPGACSLVDNTRIENHRSVTTYLKRIHSGISPVIQRQYLSQRELALDRLVFGLRRIEGIHQDDFSRESGLAIGDIIDSQTFDEFTTNGLLCESGNRLRLTRRGILLCDLVCQQIVDRFSV